MLSAFLMDLVPVRKAAFLYGSVEPDIILVSYLSGSMHGKSFHGHDYRNMSKRIQSVLARMQEGKGHGLVHSYRLGKLIHYIADSFTFPHNEMFHGSLRSHMLYEGELLHPSLTLRGWSFRALSLLRAFHRMLPYLIRGIEG